MSPLLRHQQVRHYEHFRCLGAACEDTCCDGWQVSVDQNTYQKYQACVHPVLGPQLQQWVQIQPAVAQANDFARLALQGSACPFLSEKLCSIHKELGEEYLARTCATFPRLHHQAAGVVERSLDLSCPEAARLLLTDPRPASFHAVESEEEIESVIIHSGSETPHPYFWEIRSALLSLLQDRRYPVAKRLLLVGHVCEKVSELARNGQEELTPTVLEGFALGIEAGFYEAHLQACSAEATDQLRIVLSLMTSRFSLDFTPPRYRDLYQEFVDGLQLRPGLSFEEGGARYAQAYTHRYAPFLAQYEYMLEHCLVYSAYQTLFPFGTPALHRCLPETPRQNFFLPHYRLLASSFAVIQSFLVGLAAGSGTPLSPEQALRCIQTCARALEHCTSYPPQVLQILGDHGLEQAAGMARLTQPPLFRERSLGIGQK